jgi:hypothetical protein
MALEITVEEKKALLKQSLRGAAQELYNLQISHEALDLIKNTTRAESVLKDIENNLKVQKFYEQKISELAINPVE